jgi:hypothetical protein
LHTLCDKENLRELRIGLRAAVSVERVGGIWHLRDIVVAKPDTLWVPCKPKIQFLAQDDKTILTNGKDIELLVTSGTFDPWHLITERGDFW